MIKYMLQYCCIFKYSDWIIYYLEKWAAPESSIARLGTTKQNNVNVYYMEITYIKPYAYVYHESMIALSHT